VRRAGVACLGAGASKGNLLSALHFAGIISSSLIQRHADGSQAFSPQPYLKGSSAAGDTGVHRQGVALEGVSPAWDGLLW
jgi:hypothetical protein